MTRPLIIASNRGPVSFHLDEEGEPVSSRGGGGLVTGLTSALQLTGGLWVASAMSDGDRLMTERSPGGRIEVLDEDAKYHVRYLNVPPERFDRYYNVISNRILWFVHHYLFDVARSPRFGGAVRRAWDDYVAVNGGTEGPPPQGDHTTFTISENDSPAQLPRTQQWQKSVEFKFRGPETLNCLAGGSCPASLCCGRGRSAPAVCQWRGGR